MVDPQGFAAFMAERWKEHEHGYATPAHLKIWAQQAETFNDKIAGRLPDQWAVLHPPTGTGKSEGLAVYCSLLPDENHPGVVIVTRLKDDAEKMAELINELAGKPVAIAMHFENNVTTAQLYHYPVIVITHERYRGNIAKHTWDAFMFWHGGKRKLVVIDEALSVIDYNQIDFDQLVTAYGVIPQWLKDALPREIAWIEQMMGRMKYFIEQASKKDKAGRRISPKQWKLEEAADLSALIAQIKDLPFDETILNKRSDDDRNDIYLRFKQLFTDLGYLVTAPCRYDRKGNKHLFTTAEVIVPKDRMDAVILDATAACNPIYGLLGDKVKLIDLPERARDYSNVTLHCSIGHKVGKFSMVEEAANATPPFMSGLKPYLNNAESVLFCTHKDVEPQLLGYEGFPFYEVAHWGAIDGKNDWSDCDTAIMYGIQYLDQIMPQAMLRALERWHRKSYGKERRQELIREIALGHQITCLVQAINRVRCRVCIDAKGRCAPTDIYITLPDHKRAKEIQDGIEEAMPGIRIVDWEAQATRRKVKRSNYEPGLIAYLGNQIPGKHRAQDVRQALAIPQTSFERLLKRARDPQSTLSKELAAIGVHFQLPENGKGGRSHHSHFIKE